MHTLFDFITYIKGVEYIVAILSIAGFLVLWESLKPRPFRTVTEAGRDDLEHIRSTGGARGLMKTAGKIAAAPFIGIAYVVMLPFAFFAALMVAAVNGAANGLARLAGKSASFEWRPMEAYLAGRKKKEKAAEAGKSGNK